MDGLCAKILESYNIHVKSAKKTKGYYVITTADSSYLLRKTSDSKERIVLRYELQEHLLNNDFLNIEKIHKTLDDNPFALMGDQRYVLSDHIAGHEADFDEPLELEKIMSKLASFHHKSEGLRSVAEQFYAECLTLRLSKMQKELSTLRKKITSTKSLSNFDILFLKNYDYYENNIHTAISLLGKANYQKKLDESFNKNTFSHNILKKETLVIKDGDVFITMLSGACVDHFSADIAMIISKYMKYSATRPINITKIVDMYSNFSHTKVDIDDLKIILARILLPSVFLKTAKEYYAKKRSWIPGELISELENEVSLRSAFCEYIEPLSRICEVHVDS